MLDVHAPEHGIHGVRDFFVHLFTITCGLLIALGLEASVEAAHHRHQREQAEVMIRREIRENRQALLDSSAGLKEEMAGMTKVLDTLELFNAGQPPQEGSMREGDLQFHEGPLQDSAWRTAASTGVLSYMDYGEVEKFSAAYKEQQLLETTAELALNDYLQLGPVLLHHATDMTPERAREALPFARSAMGHLSGMYFIGVGTVGTYDAALK